MKDNVLKKQFVEKDVQRLRNIMTGKYGEKTTVGTGYSKKQEFRQEGDIWVENGRKWTIKDGIKQNITKLDKAKKAHLMPLMCPKCSKVMKNKNDKTYYKIHKTCFKCVILKEEDLKREGKWEEYQREIKNSEIDNKIVEFKAYVADKLQETNHGFISEAGDKETWKGKVNTERVDENIKDVVKYLESLKK